MATERELELLAVIEEARAIGNAWRAGNWDDNTVETLSGIITALETVDTSALAAVKADAWDEGFTAGRTARGLWPRNPYRALAEKEKP